MAIEVTQVKLEIYVPEEYAERIRDALTAIGACRIGNYDHVVSFQHARGYWRPLKGSNPFSGKEGAVFCGEEVKLEARCPMELLDGALSVIRHIHPYEEPVINVIPLLNGAAELDSVIN